MGRIRRGYEARYRELLARVGARRVDEGVRRLIERAARLSREGGLSETAGLTLLCDILATNPLYRQRVLSPSFPRFFCDAGLGGLARWLRAAGYEAAWDAGIDDTELLRKSRESGATVLTTDSMLMERRLLRDRVIPSLWLPPTLSIQEQLATVFREFSLKVREPRCMTCGGRLVHGNKEALRERIPPRTYRWLDDFFVCAACGKLFWHGTHWEKIRRDVVRLKAKG